MALSAVLVLVSVYGALSLAPGAHGRVDSSEVRGLRLQAVDSKEPWSSGVKAGSGSAEEPRVEALHKEDDSWSWRLHQTALSVLRECASPSSSSGRTAGADPGSCLKSLALRALDRLARSHRELSLGAGLALVPDHKALSRSMTESHGSLDEMLGQRLLSLLQSYSLRVQLPSARTIWEAIDPVATPADASSGRKRNPLGPLLVFGSSLLPVKMSLLALLVGKALMLSTLAFVIPALRMLQSGAAGGGASGGGGHCH